MKKFLLFLLVYLCCFTGKTFSQAIFYPWSEGTLVGNKWTSNDGLFEFIFPNSPFLSYSIEGSDLKIVESKEEHSPIETITFHYKFTKNKSVLGSDCAEKYGLPYTNIVYVNHSDFKIHTGSYTIAKEQQEEIAYTHGHGYPATLSSSISTSDIVIKKESTIYKKDESGHNIKDEEATQAEADRIKNLPFNVTLRSVTQTIGRTLTAGTAYKIHFKNRDFVLKEGDDNDEVFVVGNKAAKSGIKTYTFVSNSNESDKHYLTTSGVSEATYTDNCTFNIYLSREKQYDSTGNIIGYSFADAMYYKNGNILALDGTASGSYTITPSSTQVVSDNLTTEVEIEKVEYPYINVTLVPDTYGTDEQKEEGIFGTVYLPFPFLLPEGIEAYAGTKDKGTSVELEKVVETGGALPGGAYLLHGTGTAKNTITLYPANIPPCDEPTSNIFFGSTKNPSVTKGDADLYTSEGLGSMRPYVLAQSVKNTTTNVKEYVPIGFYKYLDNTYPKGKVVFDASVDTKNSPVRFQFVRETEGISTVSYNTSNSYYDITGRKLNGLVNGINIYNGKKIIR